MLKIKNRKYIYAQLKINRQVVSFYLGKIEDYDIHKFAKVLDKKLNEYMDGEKHKFQQYRTTFGLLLKDENKVKKILLQQELLQKVGYEIN